MKEPSAEQRSTRNQFAEAIADALEQARAGIDMPVFCDDGGSPDQQIAEFGQRIDAKRERHQRQPFPEIELAHGPAQCAGLRVGADHRQHHAETGAGQPRKRRIARKHRNHGNAEHRERQQFGRADEQNEAAAPPAADRPSAPRRTARPSWPTCRRRPARARPRRAASWDSRRAWSPRRRHGPARPARWPKWDRRWSWWRPARAAAPSRSAGP